MILNKLVFPIKLDGKFVEGAVPVGKLTANDKNKDMLYVISPVVGATAITATFQNTLQTEKKEYANFEPSRLEVKDLVREDESYYELIKNWGVWQAFLPSKALGYVAYNRAGQIGVSFNFRQAIVPRIVGVDYVGEIINSGFIPTQDGYYIVKTPLYEYDGETFTFNDVLIKLDDEILIKKAIFTAENTSTLNYSVDPSIYDSDFEGFDISLTESIVHQVNENTTDIKVLFKNNNDIFFDISELKKRVSINEDEILNLKEKDIEQDNRLNVVESDIGDIEEVDRNQNNTLQDHETRITKNTQDIASINKGLVKIDNETITRNENQKLEVSSLVLNDINSRTKNTDFVAYQNTVQDFLNGKLDKKPDGVIYLINAFNKIDARYLDIDNELFIIVLELPEIGKGNKIYLAPKTGTDNNNKYDEYIYINNKWEALGTITIDLSNFFDKDEINTLLDTKVDISKQVPKTPDMIGRVGIDNDGTLWYAPYIDDIIKVRGMDSLDSMVSYEGTLQPNLTHADNGDVRVYSNTFDHVFPFNEMVESTDELGNKFVDVPVIYWKFYHDSLGNLTGCDISNKKIDDTFDIFPVHAKGKLSIGKYQAYSQGGKLYSISAVDPSMSKNIASFRTEAKAVGDDYFANDWQSWNMLQLLLTAYFGTKNTDLYFPDVSGEKSNTGTMDGYKTAVNLATGKNVFFGIENIVKNGYHFIDGVINNNEEVWFANDHATYSNTITSDYVLKGTKPTQNDYIKNYGGGLGLFPTENTGASSTTYYCDYLYFNPDLRVLLSGSYWDAGARLGVWYWFAHSAFSATHSDVGSRLIKTS